MVLLQLPNGVGWHFRAKGGLVSLEESIYAGKSGDIRRSEQIVVSGTLDVHGIQVKWRFNKVPKV